MKKLVNKNIITTFFVFITFSILILLGFWQLNRLKEKKQFLDAMQINLMREAIDLNSLNNDLIYHKVKLTGQFLSEHSIYLYGCRSMSNKKDGYYLVTPFHTQDNKIIIVVRGWFSNHNKALIAKIKNNPPHEIVGVIMPSEKKRIFIPDNDTKNNIWFTLDLTNATKSLGLNLQNFYIIQEGKDISNLEILLPLYINHLANVRNDHLEYALTWFGLAIALIAIYFYNKKYGK